MKTTINQILALLIIAVVGMGMVSCTNDDFTDNKELIKGSWYTKADTGWRSIEFNGDQWRGTYYYGDTGLVFVSGKYKWEDGDYIHITGTNTIGKELDMRLRFRWGTYQQLFLEGTPANPYHGTIFYYYVE